MKFLRRLLQKEIELYEEFKVKRYYKRAISKFISCLNISLAFLQIRLTPEEVEDLNYSVRKFYRTPSIYEKQFLSIEEIFSKYNHYFMDALEILDNVRNSKYQKGDLDVGDAIAISSYEFNNQ